MWNLCRSRKLGSAIAKNSPWSRAGRKEDRYLCTEATVEVFAVVGEEGKTKDGSEILVVVEVVEVVEVVK